ncbi:MAG: lysylphosphatidylglycerol synthase transmembrane domain-containing protein [Polyangiaceae bacterium]|nr:lysylphosphatidylglycerol synthase transmembrane domain-containing protein [Polyangiaceae bacterium]
MEESREKVTRKNFLRGGVLALATAVVLGGLVHVFGGAGALWEVVREADPGWVLVSLAAATACVLLGALRWQLVLRAIGYRLPYGRSLSVLLAVWPLGLVTPSRANELLRAFTVRELVPLPAGAGSVLAEKAVDLLVLLGLAAMGAAFAGQGLLAALLAAAAVAELALLALLMRARRWLLSLAILRSRAASLELLFDAFEALRHAPYRLAGVGVVSLVIRVLTVVITHALLLAVGARVPLLLTLTLWPTATFAGLVPVTMAGMGTRDAAFLYLVNHAGASVDHASVLAATMAYSAVAIWSFAILGLPFMFREAARRRAAVAASGAASASPPSP